MRKHLTAIVLAFVAVFTVVAISGCNKGETSKAETPVLRVGWMTSWASAGQVVESLIHTDITKKNGVKVEFKSFMFGPPMNEAALAGNLDVTIVGDMPAISLLAASDKWSVVSRTLNYPCGLMVRSDVKANEVGELKGKTIGVPFGSGPQPTLNSWLEEAGLKIGKDVTVINLTPQEMAEAFKSKRVDAIMAWEPTMTVLEKDYSARIIKSGAGVGFMCMTNEVINKYPKAVAAFVKSWKEGILYYNQHRAEADSFFSQDSKIPVQLLQKIKIADKNLSATRIEDIDTRVSAEDISKNQSKADFAFNQGLIKRKVSISSVITQ